MKTLVIFYSRTGVTRKVAEAISDLLRCEREEIVDTKDRAGAMGYLRAGRDASLKKITEIKKVKSDPSSYDMVIIGTPVWAFTMSTPVRTYLLQNKGRFKKAAFFCTQGGAGNKGAFRDMEEASGVKPCGTFVLKTGEIVRDDYRSEVKRFVEGLSA